MVQFSKIKGFIVCMYKNKPMHKYLTNLDKKNSNYIKKAMKVVNFNYEENIDRFDITKGSKSIEL